MNTFLGGRRFAVGQACHQRRQRDRQFLLAHHQCGRPRRRDGGEWHPGGAGDQRRHDGARCLRARSARCAAAPSTMISSGVASAAAVPTTGSSARPSSSDRRAEPPSIPPILPPEPPPQALPPGVYPIIGPEIATYGVVQPIARQLGMTTLGTLHDRIGDTLLNANTGTPCPADGDTRDTGSCARRRRKRRPIAWTPAGAFGLGPSPRPADRQPLHGLRRSARLRPVAGLSERHRSVARRMDTGPSRCRGHLLSPTPMPMST